MYIRKTTTKKSADGNPYSTYRIVASERIQGRVKQRTILNIGSCFELKEELWGNLCQRIEDILAGKLSLLSRQYELEDYAQKFAIRIIAERSVHYKTQKETEPIKLYEEVDISSLNLIKPRSVGVEYVSLHGVKILHIDKIMQEIGCSPNQINMAIANIIGRMTKPDSERGTQNWLVNQSALDELLNVDFSNTSSMSLHRASDILIQYKEQIEQRLFTRICSLFSLGETVTLYDLTNTYFEGELENNDKALRGFSKEKRFDCPLLTMGLVLDGSGFVKKTKIFPGNASEPGTAKDMLRDLGASPGALVIMDCGIATKATLEWLISAGYRYLVVSRERTRVFDMSKAQTIQTAMKQDLHIYRELNAEGTEARLYCYSPSRATKEQGIVNRFARKFEAELQKLSEGLTKPRTKKHKDAILQRIGRLVEKSRGISRHYTITVGDNGDTKSADEPLLATAINYEKKPVEGTIATHPGVYCLRTNATCLEAEAMWKTYTMLTDLEAVFRSLKSELGLRPIYHQTSERAEGHLFITVLAYQCVQAIRNKLKQSGINDSWNTLRKILCTQQRVTTTFQQRNNNTLHIRKSSMAETNQQRIYDALGISSSPGGVKRLSVSTLKTSV